MMDVSLEDEKVERGESEMTNGSTTTPTTSMHPNTLPTPSTTTTINHASPNTPPLAVHHTSSGISTGGVSAAQSNTHLSNARLCYVEFSLEYDIFMAYLKLHLQPDRIPQRNGLSSAAKQQKGGQR